MDAVFLVLILATVRSQCIRVLSSDPGQLLPNSTGQAEILNSSLEYYEEFTICGRFKTFNFNVDPAVSGDQAIIIQGNQ